MHLGVLFLRKDELILLPAAARAPSVFYCELYLHWPSHVVSLLQMARRGAPHGPSLMLVLATESQWDSQVCWPKREHNWSERKMPPTGIISPPPCCRDVVGAGTPMAKNLNFGGRYVAVAFQGWLSALLTQDLSKHRWRNSLTNH